MRVEGLYGFFFFFFFRSIYIMASLSGRDTESTPVIIVAWGVRGDNRSEVFSKSQWQPDSLTAAADSSHPQSARSFEVWSPFTVRNALFKVSASRCLFYIQLQREVKFQPLFQKLLMGILSWKIRKKINKINIYFNPVTPQDQNVQPVLIIMSSKLWQNCYKNGREKKHNNMAHNKKKYKSN